MPLCLGRLPHLRAGDALGGPTPPAPVFWTHQLNGVTKVPPLDPDVFASRLAQALSPTSK